MKPNKNKQLDENGVVDASSKKVRSYRPPLIDAEIGRKTRVYCINNNIEIAGFIEEAIESKMEENK